MSKVTVVGGGNGAFAVSSDLALKGHEVTLLEYPSFERNVDAVRASGGIELKSIPSSGRPSGFAPLAHVVVDAKMALEDAEAVFVVVPAYAQKAMAELCAPHLRGDQALCLMPGNLYGSVEFLRVLRQNGNERVKAVAEAECLIYTATRGERDVNVRGFKRGLGLGVFPSRETSSLAPAILNFYPEMTVRRNVLATGASNPNVLLHVPLTLLNFANVERGLDVLSYHAAFTKGVAGLVEALDDERMQLSQIGVGDMVTTDEMVRSWYSAQGVGGSSLYEIMTTNPLYAASKLPKKKDHRYITEDIPYGICPLSELLRLFGLSDRMFSAVASIASVACGKDFFASSRTLASLGLRLEGEELLRYIAEGE